MRNNSLHVLILTFVIATSSVFGFIYSVQYVNTLNIQIEDVKNEADQVKLKYERMTALHNSSTSDMDSKKKLSTYFVPPEGAVDFITSFEQTARSMGLKFSTISLDTEQSPDLQEQGREILKVSFETSGSWNNTIHFLSIVESLPYAVEIQGATLEGAEGTPSLVGSDLIRGTTKNTTKLGYWRLVVHMSILKTKENAQ